MSGQRFLWELKKLWTMPMFPVFLALCLVFNGFLMVTSNYGSSYVNYVADAAETTGSKMGAAYTDALLNFPASDERDALLYQTVGRTDSLENYDTDELMSIYTGMYLITGSAADALEGKCGQLQSAVDELAAVDASLDVLGAGGTEAMLDTLLYRVCTVVQGESMIFAVLMALYLCAREKLDRTALLVYATRTGRRIHREKVAAGLLSVLAVYVLLSLFTLGIYTLVWRLGPIWKMNISGQFHVNPMLVVDYPFITWNPMTVAQYLMAQTVLGAVVVLIFYALGYTAGLITGDAFRGFALMLVLAGLDLEALLLTGNTRLWRLFQFCHWTPMALWRTGRYWFTDLGIGGVVPWQECWCALFLSLLSGGLLCLTYRRYQRKDVK